VRAAEPASPSASSKVAPATTASPQADPQQPAKEPPFIRVRRDENNQPLALETAVARYVSASDKWPGVHVDLIGAVHIGDKSYYDALNKLFPNYDVVLYELVAPEGSRIPKEGRKGGGDHPLGAMQNGMSAMLELRHQLDCIDYQASNLVHADMSPEEFTKTMEKRGESLMQMFLRLMGQGLAQQAVAEKGGANAAAPSELGLLFALFSKDRARRLKIMMAEQFENLEGQMALFDGPEGSTIITERNKRAFEVLEKQLAAGKKRIGVFYGAGHLPDMEKRLVGDFGLRREGETWVPAWSLERRSAASPTDRPADSTRPKLEVDPPK
jgi:hypothetical protein